MPKGRGTEIKKKTAPLHRFVYHHDWFIPIFPADENELWGQFADIDYFNNFLRYDMLPIVFPGTNAGTYYQNAVSYRMYYFKGTWAEFNGDVSRLILFNTPSAVMRIFYSNLNTTSDTVTTNNTDDTSFFEVKRNVPGNYILAAAILNSDNEITNYTTFENFLSYI